MGMASDLWQGPTASEDWYGDVLAEGLRHGAADYIIAPGEPRHVNVTGDTAYVVVPANMKFNLNGRQVTQSGAILRVALRKLAQSRRIAAWAWAKGSAAQGEKAN